MVIGWLLIGICIGLASWAWHNGWKWFAIQPLFLILFVGIFVVAPVLNDKPADLPPALPESSDYFDMIQYDLQMNSYNTNMNAWLDRWERACMWDWIATGVVIILLLRMCIVKPPDPLPDFWANLRYEGLSRKRKDHPMQTVSLPNSFLLPPDKKQQAAAQAEIMRDFRKQRDQEMEQKP